MTRLIHHTTSPHPAPRRSGLRAALLLGLLTALLLVAGLTWQPMAAAQTAGDYSKEGADTCLGCHDDETAAYSASALFKTKHAQRGDKRTPFGVGGLQCEACHGPGAAHAKNKKAASITTFKADSRLPLEQRNQVCMSCHEGMSRTGWHAGAHERGQVACTDCHKVHREHDPVLAKAFTAAVSGDPTTLQTLDNLVNIQAAMISYVDDFYLMMWVTLLAMPLALILRRPARA